MTTSMLRLARASIIGLLLLAFGVGLVACDDLEFSDGSDRSDRGAIEGGDKKAAYTGPKKRTAYGAHVRCFGTFRDFKKAMVADGMGKRGRDHHWHHVVPQHDDNVDKFGAHNLHCTDNLVYLHKDEHTKLNSYYSKSQADLGYKSFRDWLKPMSFEEQHTYGVQIMKELEIEVTENPGVPLR